MEETLLKLAQLAKANFRKRIIITTRGPKSIFYVYNGEFFEFTVPQVKDEDIVDTNGAGDAFVGGFFAQLIVNNKSIDDCIKCGIWASQEVIKNTGCAFDFNKRYEC